MRRSIPLRWTKREMTTIVTFCRHIRRHLIIIMIRNLLQLGSAREGSGLKCSASRALGMTDTIEGSS